MPDHTVQTPEDGDRLTRTAALRRGLDAAVEVLVQLRVIQSEITCASDLVAAGTDEAVDRALAEAVDVLLAVHCAIARLEGGPR